MVRITKNFKKKTESKIKNEAPVSVLGCDPKCPYFPRSVGRTVDWVYDEKEPWIKRRAKPKRFICQYDGSVIYSWDKQPCSKKLDELAMR